MTLTRSFMIAAMFVAVSLAQPVGDVLTKARSKMNELSAKLAKVKGPDELRADAAIHLKAGEWMVRHPEEFYKPEYSDQLLAVLDRGVARASELENGNASWPKQKGRLSRAYRSRVDGSLQPYGLLIP